MTNHPTLGLVDVFAATIPTLAFAPGVHVNYAENGAADARWPAEAEGFSEGARWFRRSRRGIAVTLMGFPPAPPGNRRRTKGKSCGGRLRRISAW
jgi:hypothetical protein